MSHIAENLQRVEKRIEEACVRAGRDRGEVTLIAVSKTKPVSDIQEAMACGITVFGENKVQELKQKTEEISVPLHWHMIGHLQTNKVKYLPGMAEMIHSVDRLEEGVFMTGKINRREAGRYNQFETKLKKVENRTGQS